jgi:hypothetical protein
VARPANDAGHAEAAFEGGPFAASERCLPAIRPGKVLRAVVRGEDDDGVIVQTVILQMRQDRANNVVELCHPGFLNAPAVLWRAHRLVLLGQMRHDVHARGVEPHEEWLELLLRLVDELQSLVANDLVDGFPCCT